MSGLSASMWTSVSGLIAHGNKMNIVGNNIANVSTLAYKGQRVDFSDYLYTDGGSVSGTTQIGQGVSTYAVLGDYSQGSFESTNSGSDLAIDGNGYFKVRKPDSEQMYYTRAGDFYFNAKRELQNPEGMG
jgi:fagellar hook-basal body proteins